MSSLLVDDDEIDSGEQSENKKRSPSVPTPHKPSKKSRSQKPEKSEGRTPMEQSPLPDRSPIPKLSESVEYQKLLDLITGLSDRIKLLEMTKQEDRISLNPTERTVLARVAKSFTLQYRTKNPDWVAELLTLLKPLGIEEEYRTLMAEVEVKDQKKKQKKTQEI